MKLMTWMARMRRTGMRLVGVVRRTKRAALNFHEGMRSMVCRVAANYFECGAQALQSAAKAWDAGFAVGSQKCGTRALHAAAKVWGAYQAGVALLAAVDGHNDVIGEDEVVVGDPDGLVGNED